MDVTPILHLLRCPACGANLAPAHDSLLCEGAPAHAFPVVNGIPRFVTPEGECGYETHWTDFAANPASPVKIEQGRRFLEWLLSGEDRAPLEGGVFLDVGCGDGNHVPALPREAVKIALDYSCSVEVVAARYRDVPNLYVIQGDARALPLKDASVDVCFSYGCLNCIPEPRGGLAEAARVTKPGGLSGFWGYGTGSALVYHGFRAVRGIFRALPEGLPRDLFTTLLVPALLLVRNSTDMRPGKNTLAECREIISTNLRPETLEILRGRAWRDMAPAGLRHLPPDYDLPCGQKFRKV